MRGVSTVEIAGGGRSVVVERHVLLEAQAQWGEQA